MKNDLHPVLSPYLKSGIGGMNPIGIRQSVDKTIISRALSHKHLIETVERFTYKNLPKGLTQDIIERILYFRFKGAWFKFNERYYFLPFTLKGDIDSYGRYINIVPTLFTGQWKNTNSEDIAFMSGVSFKAIYDESDLEDEISNDNKAVIMTDSTLEVSQDYTPMEYMIRPFIEQLTDILILVNMDLISSAKSFTIVARDEDQKIAIENELADLDSRILSGRRYTVVTSDIALQELTGTTSKDSARYFQSFQSVDNLRKSLIGMDEGGTFMKMEHMTDMENEVNSSGGDAVLNNALRMRKEAIDLFNKAFGENVEVEISGSSEKPIVAPEGSQTKQLEGGNEDE